MQLWISTVMLCYNKLLCVFVLIYFDLTSQPLELHSSYFPCLWVFSYKVKHCEDVTVKKFSTYLKRLRPFSSNYTAGRVQLDLTLRFPDHVALKTHTHIHTRFHFCPSIDLKDKIRNDKYWGKGNRSWSVQTQEKIAFMIQNNKESPHRLFTVYHK